MEDEKFAIRDGFDAMDFDVVAAMMTSAYWSRGIGRDEVEKGARHSALVVGAFAPDDMQVAYSRVISDRTRFAYILDVFVDEGSRQRGIARQMIRHILDHSDFRDVYQWLLVTRSAHGLYAKEGFRPLEFPDRWLSIITPRPDR